MKKIVLTLSVFAAACSMDPNKKLDRSQYVDMKVTAAQHFGAAPLVDQDVAPASRSQVRVGVQRVSAPASAEPVFDDRFPNHVLIITVLPHRNPAGMVVPMYQSKQPLYDKPIFALPGELAERRW